MLSLFGGWDEEHTREMLWRRKGWIIDMWHSRGSLQCNFGVFNLCRDGCDRASECRETQIKLLIIFSVGSDFFGVLTLLYGVVSYRDSRRLAARRTIMMKRWWIVKVDFILPSLMMELYIFFSSYYYMVRRESARCESDFSAPTWTFVRNSSRATSMIVKFLFFLFIIIIHISKHSHIFPSLARVLCAVDDELLAPVNDVESLKSMPNDHLKTQSWEWSRGVAVSEKNQTVETWRLRHFNFSSCCRCVKWYVKLFRCSRCAVTFKREEEREKNLTRKKNKQTNIIYPNWNRY